MQMKVKFHGKLVGLADDSLGENKVYFEYDDAWLSSGIELSPYICPLSNKLHNHENAEFLNLPGMLYDTLPDGYGARARQAFSALEPCAAIESGGTPLLQLSHIGKNGMGALEFESEEVNICEKKILLCEYARMGRSLMLGEKVKDADFLYFSSLVGGSQPKIMACEDMDGNIGSPDFEDKNALNWLIKLNTLRPSDEDRQKHEIEYATSLLAKRFGIRMTETRLFESMENGHLLRHFGSRRFDRDNGKKLHVQTYSALSHIGLSSDSSSYSDLFRMVRDLTNKSGEVLEMFRRLVFNVLISNQDDHVKNTSFVMIDENDWLLSPAYDLLPSGGNGHRMSINEKTSNIGAQDLFNIASEFSIRTCVAKSIIDEFFEVVYSSFDEVSEESFLSKQSKNFYLDIINGRIGDIL